MHMCLVNLGLFIKTHYAIREAFLPPTRNDFSQYGALAVATGVGGGGAAQLIKRQALPTLTPPPLVFSVACLSACIGAVV
jgi:hypothetical protein